MICHLFSPLSDPISAPINEGEELYRPYVTVQFYPTQQVSPQTMEYKCPGNMHIVSKFPSNFTNFVHWFKKSWAYKLFNTKLN